MEEEEEGVEEEGGTKCQKDGTDRAVILPCPYRRRRRRRRERRRERKVPIKHTYHFLLLAVHTLNG